MERLTEKHFGNEGYYMKCSEFCANDDEMCGSCSEIDKIVDRLAAYEDTGLEPEEIAAVLDPEVAALARGLQRILSADQRIDLEAWIEADKDGRLVVLPCKVGDTVWFVDRRWDRTLGRGVSFVNDGYVKAIKYSSRPTKITVEYPDHNDREGRCKGADYFARNIGKTVFLTREEAEAALAGERKDGEG